MFGIEDYPYVHILLFFPSMSKTNNAAIVHNNNFLKVYFPTLKWTLVRSCFALCDFDINFSHASQQYWSIPFSLFIINFSCFVVISDIVVNVGSASGGLAELVPRTWSAIFLLCFLFFMWYDQFEFLKFLLKNLHHLWLNSLADSLSYL